MDKIELTAEIDKATFSDKGGTITLKVAISKAALELALRVGKMAMVEITPLQRGLALPKKEVT